MTLTHSLADAAAMIPCTERWLSDRLRDGTFTARKINGRWRFTNADIEAIVDQCLAAPKIAAVAAVPEPPRGVTKRSAEAYLRRQGRTG